MKEAFAQSEQERLAKVEPCAVCGEGRARLLVLRSCDTCHSEYAGQAEMTVALGKPEQGPWMYRIWNDKDAQWRLTDDCSWPAEPIYTTPPKRPWVGLTDEEIESCANWRWMTTCRAIEAKLKELNT